MVGPTASSLPGRAAWISRRVPFAIAALGSLKKEGDLSAAGDLLDSFEERQRSVAKHEWDALEARYRLTG
jgi:hypothetical protein